MPLADSAIIQDPGRLEALAATGLLDSPASPALERLTRLTRRLLGVPVAVVSLVDRDRQFFAASDGLEPTVAAARQTPLSHSFCQHVVAGAAPLVVDDARIHPLVHDNLAVAALHVHAYAGMPLVNAAGQALGSFCAFDDRPHPWSELELAVLRDLAQATMTEIELRAATRRIEEQGEQVRVASRVIEEQGEQMRQLLDNTQELVARLGVDQSMVYGNESWWRTLGMPAHEDSTTWFHERLDAGSQERFALAWHRVLATGESEDLEVVAVSAAYLPLDLALRLVPTFESLEVSGIRIYGRDVTEHRRVERMKDQMIGIVSHELRTPIGAVQGALQLLTRLLPADLGEKPKELLALAARNTQRLLALVNDLLDLERLETGKANLDLQPVALDEAFTVARDATAPLAERAGVLVHWGPGDAVVTADKDRLARVLINLVGNAIKFTPAGKSVRIDGALEGASWHLQVSDEGRGIPAGERDRIFERFTQVARSDATEKGGSGLGLTIARAIVLQHGGRIWVESEEGQGSVFHFTVPHVAG